LKNLLSLSFLLLSQLVLENEKYQALLTSHAVLGRQPNWKTSLMSPTSLSNLDQMLGYHTTQLLPTGSLGKRVKL